MQNDMMKMSRLWWELKLMSKVFEIWKHQMEMCKKFSFICITVAYDDCYKLFAA
jgi:hypothetical protein